MPDPVTKQGVRAVRADEPRFAARVGTTIRGKWRLDALVGLGGMAAVYAGTHRNGQRAAIKILREEFAKDPRVCERFLLEGYVANRVGHSGCVSILDDDVAESGEPYLVMELLEGETLRDYWKRVGRKIPPADVLRFAAEILDCLVACHAQGVIHRDLKPANIFLTKTGQVKILDFGVAQLRSAAASEGQGSPTAVGTPAYMSPEQAMGLSDQLDGRTDVFSVGAILHALCSGHRINQAKTEQESLMMAATTPVPSVAVLAPDLPPTVVEIIDKALSYNRRHRYATAAAMRAAILEALEKGIQTGAVAPPQMPPLPPPRKPFESAPLVPPSTSVAPPEVDPRSRVAREVLLVVESVLTTQRQSSWEDAATERALRAAHEAVRNALDADPEALRLTIRPSGFHLGRTAVWEPSPPRDAIAYALYACGIRTLSFERGITLEELRDILSVFLLDPARDLGADEDLVTVLWDKSLPHVRYSAADMLGGGDASERESFYEEANEVEEVALAYAVGEEEGASRAPHPLAPDDDVRTVLIGRLDIKPDQWRRRYVDALVEGYVDAARNRDAHYLLDGLRKSSVTLIGRGQLGAVTALFAEIRERIGARVSGNDVTRLSAALTATLFGGDSFELVLSHLRRFPEETAVFVPVLNSLPSTEVNAALAAMRVGVPESLRRALLAFVEANVSGKETQLVEAAGTVDSDTAVRLASILAKTRTPEATRALERLAQSEDQALRLEAKVLLATTPEQAFGEVSRMLDNASSAMRIAGLRALVRHGMMAAYPLLTRQVRAASFHEVAPDERAELLRSLLLLSRQQGEPVVLELVRKGGVFTSQAREASRAIAAQVLGELGTSEGTVDILRDLSTARWGISDETRTAASGAASQIDARIRGSQPPGRGSGFDSSEFGTGSGKGPPAGKR